MKKHQRFLLVILFLLLLFIFSSCSESKESKPQISNKQTNDTAITVDRDTTNLADRITLHNTPLTIEKPTSTKSIQSSGPLFDGGDAPPTTLTYIAETTAPQSGGATLQASDVSIKEGKAYISYNMAGSVYAGALHVVNFSDLNNLVVEAEVIFSDIDINALYVEENTLYLVGAADPASRSINSPAVLVALPLVNNLPTSTVQVVDIPSFAGTDIIVKDNNLYITVGSKDGGLIRIADNNLTGFDPTTDIFPITDARSLDEKNNTVGVLKGTDGNIQYFSLPALASTSPLSGLTPLRTVDFAGTATIAESKSTLEMEGNVSLVALGDGGVKALFTDSTTDTTLFEIAPLTNVTGLTADKTVSNAVSVKDNLMFRANGEAGVELFNLSAKMKKVVAGGSLTATLVGSLAFSSLHSANGLKYKEDLLYVADGKGGMKIVQVQ